ncbi:MAG: hypothetical protein FD145_894 [Candidatus Saganbacteria bacterium]|uniref:Type IV pilus assembly protein PilM n=1 Tax=Candidatus Saganbacteria bacterium TaxID=2575572 RepID=A0A833L0Z9_UNCSA|nr:MAG: hypothetical protein FD145_894 [Candidatus Saganbacteria bacterium]
MVEKSILGIDLRVCSVKVVEMLKGAKEYFISGWGMEELPPELADKHPEREVAQAKSLQKIMAVSRIKCREAIVVVGGADVLVKRINLPLLSHAEAREAIKWKIKDEITYPLENAVVDYIPISKIEGKDEFEFLTAVAQRETISRILEVLNLAKIRPVSIVPVALALAQTYREELTQDVIKAILYMGRKTINVGFFKGPKLLFNRDISIGGEDITKAMTSVVVSEEGKLELKFEEAEKIKLEYGIPVDLETFPKLGDIPIAQLQAVVRPALEKVEGEILRTLEYFKGQQGQVEVNKVIFCGGSSKTPHLMEFLSNGLGIKFEAIDPIKNIIVDSKAREKASLSIHASQLSAAIGAALSRKVKGINLLPEEIRDRMKILIRKHSNPLEISVAFIVLLALVISSLFIQSFFLRTQINEVKNQINQIKPRLTRLEQLEKEVREEEGRKGIFKTIELNRIKIPEVLEDISFSLPEAVLLNEVAINELAKSIKIKGSAFQKGNTAENILSRFVLELSNANSFEKIELIQATKNDAFQIDAYDFEITGNIKRKK